jgi:hypothetical protein
MTAMQASPPGRAGQRLGSGALRTAGRHGGDFTFELGDALVNLVERVVEELGRLRRRPGEAGEVLAGRELDAPRRDRDAEVSGPLSSSSHAGVVVAVDAVAPSLLDLADANSDPSERHDLGATFVVSSG